MIKFISFINNFNFNLFLNELFYNDFGLFFNTIIFYFFIIFIIFIILFLITDNNNSNTNSSSSFYNTTSSSGSSDPDPDPNESKIIKLLKKIKSGEKLNSEEYKFILYIIIGVSLGIFFFVYFFLPADSSKDSIIDYNSNKELISQIKKIKSVDSLLSNKDIYNLLLNKPETASGFIVGGQVASYLDSYFQGTKVVPEGTKVVPEGTKVVPEETKVVTPEMKVFSDVTKFLSKETKGVPEGTKVVPEETKVVSKGTKVVPEETKVVSKGTKVVPEETKIVSKGTKDVQEEEALINLLNDRANNDLALLAQGQEIDFENNVDFKNNLDMFEKDPNSFSYCIPIFFRLLFRILVGEFSTDKLSKDDQFVNFFKNLTKNQIINRVLRKDLHESRLFVIFFDEFFDFCINYIALFEKALSNVKKKNNDFYIDPSILKDLEYIKEFISSVKNSTKDMDSIIKVFALIIRYLIRYGFMTPTNKKLLFKGLHKVYINTVNKFKK